MSLEQLTLILTNCSCSMTNERRNMTEMLVAKDLCIAKVSESVNVAALCPKTQSEYVNKHICFHVWQFFLDYVLVHAEIKIIKMSFPQLTLILMNCSCSMTNERRNMTEMLVAKDLCIAKVSESVNVAALCPKTQSEYVNEHICFHVWPFVLDYVLVHAEIKLIEISLAQLTLIPTNCSCSMTHERR
jgi:hypothetical protein